MKRNDNELTPEEFTGRYVRKSSLSYRILRAILTPIAWLLYRPVFHGKERIPAEGPVLLCTNHRSGVDPAFICMSTPRVVHYLAARELFDKIVGFFFRLALCIPVDRKVHTGNPMFAAKTVLSRNEVIGIFPEGKRNYSRDILLPFKFGAVSLARETGAVIVPSVIVGRFIPFISRIHVYYGDPYTIPADADMEKENEKLRRIMLDLYISHAVHDPRLPG